MFRRVLVPLDGTVDAETVLDHVAPLMAPDGEAVLLHVLPEPALPAAGNLEPWLALQKKMEDYLGRVDFRGFEGQVRTFVDVGDPAERILAVSESVQADLIGVATHPWRGRPGSGIGTIARRILRDSDRAVLFATPGRPPGEGGLRRILLPLESPCGSSSNLDPIVHLAAGLNAEVMILHVEPPEVDPLEGRRTDPPLAIAAHDRERRYREAADYLKSFGVEARSIITRGDPTREILEQAKALSAPMIALRTHGRRGLERIIAGSVAERVIRNADRPVLLLRPSPVAAAAPLERGR